jgi:cyclohexanone monooxygenase
VRTEDHDYALDVIVLATGFDAMTGALNRIDVGGREGLSLKDKWAVGPRGYLGLATGGFPNFLTITGPLSPSVISNMVTAIEQHVDWIAELIAHMEQNHIELIDVAPEAEDAWVAHVAMVGSATIFTAPTCNSWYLGANVPGKPRVFTPYVGGIGTYGAKLQDVVRNGYEGFTLTAAPAR